MTIIRLILHWAFNILEFTVLLECILSWLPSMRYSGFYYFIAKINGPFLAPVRKLMDKCMSSSFTIDISPFVLILFITFIRRLLMV